ncbi:MAG: zf-HC2 domain-containing protein [Planctomycetes bacterium]|nr:zf-HC2 domain-containing protein [Planctomycetota bacterium]
MSESSCHRAEVLINHYLDDELTAEEAKELSAHLKACAACRKEFAEARAVELLLGGVAAEPPPPSDAQSKPEAPPKQGTDGQPNKDTPQSMQAV